MSPTALSHLRRLGFLAAVVERWLPKVNRRSDLFGVGDARDGYHTEETPPTNTKGKVCDGEVQAERQQVHGEENAQAQASRQGERRHEGERLALLLWRR